MNDTKSGYAPVNGLEMYYEIHGEGEPLIVLHGAYMTVGAMGEIIPMLAEKRQVVAVEFQGHGRTADIDRPLTYEQMADDVAALLGHLRVEKADVFGYSMGGGVAIQVVVRHPGVVRKVVAASATYKSEGFHPELVENIEHITPEVFEETPIKEEYDRISPNPDDFPTLVEKLKALDLAKQDWPADDIRGIEAPAFLIVADSDAIKPDHAVEMFRLLGGGVFGDLAGLPTPRLAVLPATTHVGMMERSGWLNSMISEFLDAPIPENE